MISISLCMIVKNEEEVIGRCLGSVYKTLDEIIIVDTGSTDSTKTICSKYTDQIFDFQWIQDFAAARNFAFSKATSEYILWLDADDILLPEDLEKLILFKQTLPPVVDAVNMVYSLGQDENGKITSSLRRNRLVRRDKNYKWIGPVHEYLEVYGNILTSDIIITHRPLSHDANRNIEIYRKRQAAGEDFSPRDLYYFANELLDHRFYQESAEYYLKFLDTKKGWVEDELQACGKLADCYAGLGDPSNEELSTLRAFLYDTPRAETCCRMGFYFMRKNMWHQAIYWYKLATEIKRPENNWGFMNEACWTWLPQIQLCVCYYQIGDYENSYQSNENASKYNPTDPRILSNRKLLEPLVKKEK